MGCREERTLEREKCAMKLRKVSKNSLRGKAGNKILGRFKSASGRSSSSKAKDSMERKYRLALEQKKKKLKKLCYY